MTSNPPAGPGAGASSPGLCKRPGCGNPMPVRDRGRTPVFCSDDCARRYHNDARPPAAAADSGADPLAALDAVTRQAAVLTRAAAAPGFIGAARPRASRCTARDAVNAEFPPHCSHP